MRTRIEFAFRTRVLDYLWPASDRDNNGDAFGDLVVARDLGAAVSAADDVDAPWPQRWQSLGGDRRRRTACAAASQWLERNSVGIGGPPLVEFCQAPRRAPDLVLPGCGSGAARIDGPMFVAISRVTARCARVLFRACAPSRCRAPIPFSR